MRGLIPDPHAMAGHHAPLEIDPALIAESGFAAPQDGPKDDGRGTRA